MAKTSTERNAKESESLKEAKTGEAIAASNITVELVSESGQRGGKRDRTAWGLPGRRRRAARH
jgi:hypothetical protein